MYSKFRNDIDEVIAIAIKADFNSQDLADLNQRSNDFVYNSSEFNATRPQTLNTNERSRLDELYNASRSLTEPVEMNRDF